MVHTDDTRHPYHSWYALGRRVYTYLIAVSCYTETISYDYVAVYEYSYTDMILLFYEIVYK